MMVPTRTRNDASSLQGVSGKPESASAIDACDPRVTHAEIVTHSTSHSALQYVSAE